tara:strand:+ start:126 stop:323 length:198 start_codon:yes stop_codon:yes gene_type:complete
MYLSITRKTSHKKERMNAVPELVKGLERQLVMELVHQLVMRKLVRQYRYPMSTKNTLLSKSEKVK